MKYVSIMDPAADRRWDEFVLTHPQGSLFHTARWAEILRKTFFYTPEYIALEEDGRITGGIPFMRVESRLTGRRLICLPRTSFCDPLAGSPEDMSLLIDAAKRHVVESRLGYLEIKPRNALPASLAAGLKAYSPFVNHVLNIEAGLDDLWKRFDRSCVRQRIARAEKSGISVRTGTDESDLRVFYRLYRRSSVKNGVPHRPYAFFNTMWRTLGPSGEMVVVLAEIGNRTGSAGVFLRSRERLLFEFLGNDYTQTEHSPVHALVWEMIRRAKAEGFRFFDFGLTPMENTGLLNFKRRWGAEEHPVHSYFHPDATGYKKLVATGGAPPPRLKGFGRLSKSLMRTAASRLYRHFG